MQFFKAFRKTEPIEQKSDSTASFEALYLSGSTVSGKISPTQAYAFYDDIPALATAIDIIAWAFLQIPPVLRNKKTKELLHKAEDHPLLELLYHPGGLHTAETFAYELMTAFLLCNEVYPVAIGNINYKPIEITIEKPQYVSIQDGNDGRVNQIDVTSHANVRSYMRNTKANPYIWTFTTRDNLNQLVQFSSLRIGDTYRGDSLLNAIQRNLNLVKYGLTHNVNLLENGGRPSGLFSPAQGVSMAKNVYDSFKREIYSMFTGFKNAGRIIASPVAVDYKNFMTSNRDMDFARLLEQSRNEIFSRYGIPLPYISEKVMTLSNSAQAAVGVYDSAVLPRAHFLYKQLGTFLLPRYKDGDLYELTINEAQLPALQERLATRLKLMFDTYTFSPNERRLVAGLGGAEGGDIVYQPGNVFPLGSDLNTTDAIG